MKNPPPQVVSALDDALEEAQAALNIMGVLPKSELGLTSPVGQVANTLLNNSALNALFTVQHIADGQASCQKETGLPPSTCLAAAVTGVAVRTLTEVAGLASIGAGIATISSGAGLIPGALAVSAGGTMLAHADQIEEGTRKATSDFLKSHQRATQQVVENTRPSFPPLTLSTFRPSAGLTVAQDTLSRSATASSALPVAQGTLTRGAGLRVDPQLQPFMPRG